MDKKPANKQRIFTGEVVSDKMDQTIVVKVTRALVHPIYKKHITRSKKYKVHDSKNEFKVGDKINFKECRPLSKDKRWRVIGKA